MIPALIEHVHALEILWTYLRVCLSFDRRIWLFPGCAEVLRSRASTGTLRLRATLMANHSALEPVITIIINSTQFRPKQTP
jgi:hypothetical protein